MPGPRDAVFLAPVVHNLLGQPGSATIITPLVTGASLALLHASDDEGRKTLSHYSDRQERTILFEGCDNCTSSQLPSLHTTAHDAQALYTATFERNSYGK